MDNQLHGCKSLTYYITEDCGPLYLAYINDINIKYASISEITIVILPALPFDGVSSGAVRLWRKCLTLRGLKYLSRRDPRISKIRTKKEEFDINRLDRVPDFDIKSLAQPKDLLRLEGSSKNLGKSIYSSLVTEYAKSETFFKKNWRQIVDKLNSNFKTSFRLVEAFNLGSSKDYELCHIVLNGRFTNQAGALEALRRSGIFPLHLEHGGKRGAAYWLESFPPNSRVSFQKNYLDRREFEEIESDGDVYNEKAVENSGSPPNWRFNQERHAQSVRRLKDLLVRPSKAVYFYSSTDEFVGLGDEWASPCFENQEQALDVIHQSDFLADYNLILRIHPNLVNKSWREFLHVTLQSRKFGVPVIDAFWGVPADLLLSDAKLVLTWGSSVGCESSAEGIPTILMSPSHYDIVADVYQWNEMNEIKLGHGFRTPQVEAARDYLRYLQSFGVQVTTSAASEKFAKDEALRILGERILTRIFLVSTISQSPMVVIKVLTRIFGVDFVSCLFDRFFKVSFFKKNKEPCQ